MPVSFLIYHIYLLFSLASDLFLSFVLSGGFYSDTKAFVNDGCRKCTIGTFVHYNEAPGKRPFDCKPCPEGNSLLKLPLLPHYGA